MLLFAWIFDRLNIFKTTVGLDSNMNLGMNSEERKPGVGSVVVKRCNMCPVNRIACSCYMLLTQIGGQTGDLDNKKPPQAWFCAHNMAGEILEVVGTNYPRYVLLFTMQDKTEWKSAPTSLRFCTIFVDGWPSPPHRLLMPIDVIRDINGDRLSDDDSSRLENSREVTREQTLPVTP